MGRSPLTMLAAVAALVAIGGLEASESARQLSEMAGRPRLEPSGAGLSALGAAASVAVYVALGWRARDARDALRLGALCGALAGVLGGALRAWVIAPAVTGVVKRYAVVPDPFVPSALAIYVLLAALAGTAIGAALTFSGARIKAARSRPRS